MLPALIWLLIYFIVVVLVVVIAFFMIETLLGVLIDRRIKIAVGLLILLVFLLYIIGYAGVLGGPPARLR
jgi:hypothetical protein